MPNIKTKGWSGSYTEHADVPKVWLESTESTEDSRVLVPFTYGEAVSKTVVELDFSEGDMGVAIPDGELVTELTIKKPENLVPEYIVKDVLVAGVLGTHEGGSSISLTPISKSGSFTPTSSGNVVVEHGLGVPPDIVIVYGNQTAAAKVANAFGFCDELVGAVGEANQYFTFDTIYGPTIFLSSHDIVARDESGVGQISSAGPNTFKLGGATFSLDTAVKYRWVVIGGLVERSSYIYLKLSLDGYGNLVVIGGTPEVTALELYVDGVLKGTLEYSYAETFTADISGIVDNRKKYEITVVPVGEGIEELYTGIFANTVYGWVSEPAGGYALVDIDMARDGLNMGTGGSDYDATLIDNGTFSNGKFVVNSSGAMTIPAAFMSGADPWTIIWAVDCYTPKTDVNYGRFARGDKDVPSLFYQKSAATNLFKLTSSTVFASGTDWYDLEDVKPWGGTSSNALSIDIPQNKRTVIAFRNDGEFISIWVNGEMKVRQAASKYTSSYKASTFGVGNTASGNSYNMSYMECSMFRVWDRALTDEEMATII